MIEPDIPEDEENRLNTLKSYNVLDTLPEERFDRLTRIANAMFGVPIALISLVDENRQWFKSSVGLSVSETPRDISFCGHAILGSNVFVINDAKEDPRFSDNPLVLGELNLRFYAGCPLNASNGSRLGTICLIDHHPREFNQQEVAMLEDLAALVEREIELTKLATIDELTDIPNRRGFQMLADKHLQFCQRKKLPASIVYFDIDEFKKINDLYGHAEGDRALSIFANNMRSITRDSDVVGRMGGDEFVILFTDTNRKSTRSAISRFTRELDENRVLENLEYRIDFSHGITEFDPDMHTSIGDLLKDSDRLMYAQKCINS